MVMEHLSCLLLRPQLPGQCPLPRSINRMGLYDVSDTEHREKSSTAFGWKEGRGNVSSLLKVGTFESHPLSGNFSFKEYLLLNPEPYRKPNSPFQGLLRRANPDHSICHPLLQSQRKLVLSTSSRCSAHESSCVLPGFCLFKTGIRLHLPQDIQTSLA